jgi:hypothetical protein
MLGSADCGRAPASLLDAAKSMSLFVEFFSLRGDKLPENPASDPMRPQ